MGPEALNLREGGPVQMSLGDSRYELWKMTKVVWMKTEKEPKNKEMECYVLFPLKQETFLHFCMVL